MQNRFIYITDEITFQDIIENKITKAGICKKQIHNWYVKPAQLLAEHSKLPNNYELEIALLTLLIIFFESHGQYLGGISSEGSSRGLFKHGFRAFLDYLVSYKGHMTALILINSINKLDVV